MTDTRIRTRLGIAWDQQLPQSWKDVLSEEWKYTAFRDFARSLDVEFEHHDILPSNGLLFNAFRHTPFEQVRVVVLGQDPYPDRSFAHGLAFSVRPGVRIPLSLRNIFKELSEDLSVPLRQNGSLTDWAQQGVLLLNTCLTVRAGHPGSHAGRGWEPFTDNVIRILSDKKEHLVFLLWGSHAIKKDVLIDQTKHLVLRSSHPSFRSCDKPCQEHPPFRNSKPFSQTNVYLVSHGLDEIQWSDTEE